MGNHKGTELSITLAAIDRTQGPFRAVKARIDSLAKPAKSAIAGFKDLGGGVVGALGGVISKVAGVIGDLLDKIPALGVVITGIVGGAVAGLVHLVDKFDDLGKKAARLGVGVNFLAEMRFAAEKTGVPLEQLDEGMKTFSQNLGQARANTGRMVKFLNMVSPALLSQLKAAKDNRAAFLLLADAFAKVKDPAKRAALAQKTFGDSDLGLFLAQGSKGIQKYADQYDRLAGSQEGATGAASEAKDAMIDLHAAIDGAEAGIVAGLAPALTIVVKQLSEWFVAHRQDVADWAKKIGEELPGAINKVVDAVKDAVGWLKDAVDYIKELADTAGGLRRLLGGGKVGEIIHNAEFGSYGPVTRIFKRSVTNSGPTNVRDAVGDIAGDDDDDDIDPIGDAMAAVQAQAKAFRARQPVADMSLQFNERPDISATLGGMLGMTPQQSVAAPAAPSEAKVTVDFKNAPRGTRVTTDPRSSASVDLSVGYNMLPGLP